MELVDGKNAIYIGTIGKVEEPTIIKTPKGNIPHLNFSICTEIGEDGNKIWKRIECWGALAHLPNIKKWNTALVAGEKKISSYVNKNGEEVKSESLRATYIQICETESGFEKINKAKEEEKQQENNVPDDIPTELKQIDDDNMPF